MKIEQLLRQRDVVSCDCNIKLVTKTVAVRFMESLDYWRMCDELSVMQVTLLIIGLDPAKYEASEE